MVEPTEQALQRSRLVIYKAIEQDKDVPVKTIMEHGFPIDAPVHEHDVNTLMLAASIGSVKMLQTVLTLGPNINAKDKIGRTALHFACRRGSLEHFEVLIQYDTLEIDGQTDSGVTPLMMAVYSGNVQLIAACLNSNCNPFLQDALERSARDYASSFKDVLGVDVR